ncbi:unnamed protein product [Macrosiphum euphorbiae]|uniref:Uncharacterized protein n=1 Tax=Macrosiphum euphorbiae TaxID=13131 RepID=A0AAV0VP26_9HEMI|nr:unnamed protein product [Macrosiphum euphorbiae]
MCRDSDARGFRGRPLFEIKASRGRFEWASVDLSATAGLVVIDVVGINQSAAGTRREHPSRGPRSRRVRYTRHPHHPHRVGTRLRPVALDQAGFRVKVIAPSITQQRCNGSIAIYNRALL